jgi:choline dehydrogenase
VLGGGSSVNGTAYVRGNPADFDEWQQPGWDFAGMLPYFRRSEDNERGADEFHGVGGPMRVSDGRTRNPSSAAFTAAALEAGYPHNPDFNGATQEGFGAFQVTQRDGRRASTASEFLRPALNRPNLTVETDLEVHRVLVSDGRAVGVVGNRLNEIVEIRAAREVIVSAGAYNSPKLLMLSGIGPADQLRSFGLPVVVDQPQVGRNLQDHPHVWLSFAHDQPVSLLAAGEPAHVQQYARDATGLLTSGGPETDGFLSPPTHHAISFGASVAKPCTRGHVTLFSPEPTAKPKIVQNYLADSVDLATAVDGVRISLEISRQSALRPYTREAIAAPDSDSEADLLAFARRNALTGHHPVGTCAMGRVVDAQLRVLGIESLRVVDASIMPTIVRGNTNAPVIAIAEKAADLILHKI